MSRVARTPILLLCSRSLMHCKGETLFRDVYTLVFDLVGSCCFYWGADT